MIRVDAEGDALTGSDVEGFDGKVREVPGRGEGSLEHLPNQSPLPRHVLLLLRGDVDANVEGGGERSALEGGRSSRSEQRDHNGTGLRLEFERGGEHPAVLVVATGDDAARQDPLADEQILRVEVEDFVVDLVAEGLAHVHNMQDLVPRLLAFRHVGEGPVDQNLLPILVCSSGVQLEALPEVRLSGSAVLPGRLFHEAIHDADLYVHKDIPPIVPPYMQLAKLPVS
eukprot:761511-Hanusia_phi.AAC.3